MEKGCPQGFIIGPAAWCWTMDTLLNNIEAEFDQDDVETIAYADDLILFIKANSRREVERLGAEALALLEKWCKLHKLSVSSSKTVTLAMKGKFDKGRPPILKIDDKNIKYCLKLNILVL